MRSSSRLITPLLLALFLFLNSTDTYCQQETPVDIKNIDVDNIDGQDIPSIKTLRQMGATEAEIREIEEVRKNKLAEQKASNDAEIGHDDEEKGEDETGEDETGDEEEDTEEDQDENRELKSIIQKKDEVYGHSFLQGGNISFYEKATNIKAPDNYVLGASDEVTVAIWGYLNYNTTFRINETGFINPSLVGRIYLRDLTFKKARSLIRSRFSNSYDLGNAQLEVTLSYSRIITANIIGEVEHPGSYTIPAINTAFNALISVGGPTDIGSVRNIKIKREGKVIKTLDVYEFLMNPSKNMDFFLSDNDFIYISPIGNKVKLEGLVKRPLFYELKKGEDLEDLIKFAGGLSARAYTRNIQIERLTENKVKLIDINLDSLIIKKQSFELYDGDVVKIRAIPIGFSNAVEIVGAARLPGVYELRNGYRVSDLLKMSEGLRFDAYTEEAILFRLKDDLSSEFIKINLGEVIKNPQSKENIPLMPMDKLQVFSKTTFVDNFAVSVRGAVRNPGDITYGQSLNLKQAIQLSGGLKGDAYLEKAYITRRKADQTFENITLELDTANNMTTLSSFALEKGDRILIMSYSDFKDDFIIAVLGHVRSPGSIPFSRGMTLKDALNLANGLKPDAALDVIEISRVLKFDDNNGLLASREIFEKITVGLDLKIDKNSEQIILEPLDYIFVRKSPDYQKQRLVTILGEVRFPGTYPLKYANERVLDIVKRAGDITDAAYPEGSVMKRKWHNLGIMVLDLKKVLKHKNSKMNYILLHNDTILVPRVSESVMILGAIENPRGDRINAPYLKGKRAGIYIKKYGGGFKKKAFRKKTIVIEANGRLRRTKQILGWNIYPKTSKGAEIIIPLKEKKEEKEKSTKEGTSWRDFSQSILAQLTAVMTVVILYRTAFPPGQ